MEGLHSDSPCFQTQHLDSLGWPCATSSRQRPTPRTYVVHDESLPLPEDEPGRVRVELDGEVGAGRVELLGAAAANVLPQDAGGELVPVVDGEDVAVGDVQAERRVWLESSVCPGRTQHVGLKGQPGDLPPGHLPPGVRGRAVPAAPGTPRLEVPLPAVPRLSPRPPERSGGPRMAGTAGDTGQRQLQPPSTPGMRLLLSRRGWGGLAPLPPLQGQGQGMDAYTTVLVPGRFSGCPGLAAWVNDHINPKDGH